MEKPTPLTEEERKIYQPIAQAAFEKNSRIATQYAGSATEFAKWLLSALLAMNGGAILGISTITDGSRHLFGFSGLFFIFGMACALISGLAAWLSWDRAATLHNDLAEPNARFSAEWMREPTAGTLKFMGRTRNLALGFGIASAISLISGAVAVWYALVFGAPTP